MAFKAVAEWGDDNGSFQLAGCPPILHDPMNYSQARLREYSQGHEGFYGYLRAVDVVVAQRCFGLGLLDMPDHNWRECYDDRIHPGEAAKAFVDEEMME